jgi:hypothetical protein
MSLYINPPERAETEGRKIALKNSLSETESQLKENEKMSAVFLAGGRKVALIMNGERDFRDVRSLQSDFLGLYAIPKDLADMAH